MKTTLTKEEVMLKMVDSEGSMPVANAATGLFKGEGWVGERTIDKVILAESPFARCEAHSVMSEDGKTLVKDWLWMEEREHVNVAVMDENKMFIVMKQRKYGISGESLSTIGGFLEEGESPFQTAVREVAEEMGMGSKATRDRMTSLTELNISKGDPSGTVNSEESQDWIFLGKYRTSTNRGGGFVNVYFLKNAVPIAENGGTADFKATEEGEKQNVFKMSIEDVTKAVKNAEFQEAKWTNALSLSLIQILTGALEDN